MVATPVVALLHVPPEEVLPRVEVAPRQMFRLPEMADSVWDALTVTAWYAEVVPPHPPVIV